MSKSSQKNNIAYFLSEEKYFGYLLTIEQDKIAITSLLESHFNKIDIVDEEIFALLCECYGGLYHLEAALFDEDAIISYDEKNRGYLLDSKSAAKAVIFLEMVNLSKESLLKCNVSLLKH